MIKKLIGLGLISLMPYTVKGLEVTVGGQPTPHDNLIQLIGAFKINPPSTDTLTIKLLPGFYDHNIKKRLVDDIRNPGITLEGTIDPIPLSPTTVDSYPTSDSASILLDALDVPSGTTLRNIVVYMLPDNLTNQLIKVRGDNVLFENCYFVGNNLGSETNRALELSENFNNVRVKRCYIRDVVSGIGISGTDSSVRDTIFRETTYGVIAFSGADLGTELDPGNNVWFRNEHIAVIYGGVGYPIQGGFFYDKEGNLLRTERDIIDIGGLIDVRSTETLRLQSIIGSDIDISNFYTTPHPLFPGVNNVKEWGAYK